MLPIVLLLTICIRFPGLQSQEMAKAKPRILVFDLDYTLWPFWVDTHVNPPFQKNSKGDIVDTTGVMIKCYPEVPQVLSDLHKEGYTLAVASRTGEVEGARQLLDLFGWKNYFSHEEIYPGGKTKHLTRIKNAFGVEFKEMIFFDDEGRNIRDVSQLGVLSVLVRNGVTKKIVDDGLSQFSSERSGEPDNRNWGNKDATLQYQIILLNYIIYYMFLEYTVIYF